MPVTVDISRILRSRQSRSRNRTALYPSSWCRRRRSLASDDEKKALTEAQRHRDERECARGHTAISALVPSFLQQQHAKNAKGDAKHSEWRLDGPAPRGFRGGRTR